MTYLINEFKTLFLSDYALGMLTISAFAVGFAVCISLIARLETKISNEKK